MFYIFLFKDEHILLFKNEKFKIYVLIFKIFYFEEN